MKYLPHLILFLVSIFFYCQQENSTSTKIEKGKFLATITETGELHSVNSKLIIMPFFGWEYGRPQIIQLEKEGTIVEKGQIVGMIDTAGVVRVLGQKEADLEIAKADLEKMKVEHITQIEKIDGELKSAEAALKQAHIDTQRVRFESTSQKEINKLKLKIAQINFNKAKDKIEHTQSIQKEEILIQQAKIKQTVSEIEKAKRTIDKFILRAPSKGMVVYRKKRRSSEKISVGDQLFHGEAMIELPDLSKIKVLTSVNETDIEKIKVGLEASVKLDAFPKISFSGKIITVSKICHKKDRESNIKIFDVEILLEKADRLLKPGMTVSCEIVTSEIEDVLFVNNEFIYEDENGFFLYIGGQSDKNKVKVKIGPRNNKLVVVYGDIKPGLKIFKIQNLEEA
jgi:biotin carboxyl carrier protein